MARLLTVCIITILTTIPVFAQSVDTAWTRRYNGSGDYFDEANDMAIDKAGNAYVTGVSSGNGTGFDYSTIKYDSEGNEVWVKTYDNGSDYAFAVAADNWGNVSVAGRSDGAGTYEDYVTIKYTPEGDTAWLRRYNRSGYSKDYAFDVAVDATGMVYVTGYTELNASNEDYLTMKYYPFFGDTAWVRTYDGKANYLDEAFAITVDDSGNVYVTGQSYGNGTYWDYLTIKYYSNGDTAWTRRYDGPAHYWDWAIAIATDDYGNVYVTGGSYGVGSNFDYVTIKYYPNGDAAWIRTYDGPGNYVDMAYTISVDNNGNVYVSGGSYGIGSGLDYLTIRYRPNGDVAWVRRYDGPGHGEDVTNALALDVLANVYVTGGSSDSASLSSDYCTIKYDSSGNELWLKRYNGPGDGYDVAHAISVDGSGNVYVTGGSAGSGTDVDYLTIKYVQFLCGDANADGKVSLPDIVFVVSYLFKHGRPPEPMQCGDANNDGKVTIADIVYLVAYLFKFGPPPIC